MTRAPLLPLTVLLAVLSGGGCASAPASPPAAPAPVVPPSAPVVAAPGLRRLSLPDSARSTRWVVEQRALIEADSAGRTQTAEVTTRGLVSLALRRDSLGQLRATGMVDSFTLRASELLLPATSVQRRPVPVATGAAARRDTRDTRDARDAGVGAGRAPARTDSTSVVPLQLFDATLDRARWHVAPRPALPNECDRPEAASVQLARDLLVRLPRTITRGDRWTDSVYSVACRGGVPLVISTTVTHQVDSIVDGADGAPVLHLERRITQRVSGTARTPWQRLTISGSGTGRQQLVLDGRQGQPVRLDGTGDLELLVVDSAATGGVRTRRVRQRLTTTARPVGAVSPSGAAASPGRGRRPDRPTLPARSSPRAPAP